MASEGGHGGSHGHSHAHGHSHGGGKGNPNKDAWDKHQADYDKDSADFVAKAVPMMKKLLAGAGMTFDEDRKALDFGAGTGNLAIPLATSFCGHVTAVDLSEGMLAHLKKKIQSTDIENRFRIICAELGPGDVVKKPSDQKRHVKEGDYDLVLCSMVIHHVPDRKKIIEMFKSMLKPGGVLMIYEFEATPQAKEMMDTKKESHGVFHDGLTPMAFLELMTSAGMKTIHAEHAFAFSFGKESYKVLAGVATK
uniref:Uncharacterized protein n=1 Tax=Lotharella oceanica TaxID=641309 RepID=A0A7S2U0V2_9EUKA|mmetsp:Transcript_5047/g.10027  ORF Transcript_5047/g.10027 Transcript_5047/m.10027 type:complete len:251 (+) Transcript_5047:97-849(+)